MCSVGVLVKVVMYVLVEVVCDVVCVMWELGVDVCIVVGGGLMIGFVKVIVLEVDLLIVVLLMIYVGFEMMLFYGLIEVGVKKIGKDWCVLLWCVVYDLLLMFMLLVKFSVVSGMNVIVYVVEGLYVYDGSLVYSLMVEEGICVFVSVLFCLYVLFVDVDVCSDVFYGVWFCGIVFGNVQMGVYYKICYMFGGVFNFFYVDVYIVVFLYVFGYNVVYVLNVFVCVVCVIGVMDVIVGLCGLIDLFDVCCLLCEIGMLWDGIDCVVDLIVEKIYLNLCLIE